MQIEEGGKHFFAFLLLSLVPTVISCEPSGFECNHLADGCVAWTFVNNGEKDCLRDGSDETMQATMLAALHRFPQGLSPLLSSSCQFSSVFSILEIGEHKIDSSQVFYFA